MPGPAMELGSEYSLERGVVYLVYGTSQGQLALKQHPTEFRSTLYTNKQLMLLWKVVFI